MRTYHWKEYGFIGTVPDFARHFGICKSPTFVNAVRRVSRHVYNCMNAREQAEYEEKRERVKPAYRLYLDEERTRFIEMTKEEYEAVGLPVVQEEVGMFKLSYRNRSLPASFVGNGRDESPVASAMKKISGRSHAFRRTGHAGYGLFQYPSADRTAQNRDKLYGIAIVVQQRYRVLFCR